MYDDFVRCDALYDLSTLAPQVTPDERVRLSRRSRLSGLFIYGLLRYQTQCLVSMNESVVLPLVDNGRRKQIRALKANQSTRYGNLYFILLDLKVA